MSPSPSCRLARVLEEGSGKGTSELSHVVNNTKTGSGSGHLWGSGVAVTASALILAGDFIRNPNYLVPEPSKHNQPKSVGASKQWPSLRTGWLFQAGRTAGADRRSTQLTVVGSMEGGSVLRRLRKHF